MLPLAIAGAGAPGRRGAGARVQPAGSEGLPLWHGRGAAGTLDSLMQLSDDLDRIDRMVEGVVHRIEKEMRENAQGGQVVEPSIDGAPIDRFLTSFEWDQARYPVKSTLAELVSMIQDRTASTDEELKAKLLDYNTIKSTLAQWDRKGTGALNQRSLTEYVKKEHVVSSEKLTSIFCAVPKFALKEFLEEYEGFGSFSTDQGKINGVVPRSAKMVTQDSEYDLVRVVVFRAAEDEFKSKAREARATVRDFAFVEGQDAKDKADVAKLKADVDKAWSSLVPPRPPAPPPRICLPPGRLRLGGRSRDAERRRGLPDRCLVSEQSAAKEARAAAQHPGPRQLRKSDVRREFRRRAAETRPRRRLVVSRARHFCS
jgi:hypothetical protein